MFAAASRLPIRMLSSIRVACRGLKRAGIHVFLNQDSRMSIFGR